MGPLPTGVRDHPACRRLGTCQANVSVASGAVPTRGVTSAAGCERAVVRAERAVAINRRGRTVLTRRGLACRRGRGLRIRPLSTVSGSRGTLGIILVRGAVQRAVPGPIACLVFAIKVGAASAFTRAVFRRVTQASVATDVGTASRDVGT